MPDRTQVADLSGPQALQPTAQPVDAYHSPLTPRPRPPDAQLGDIAAALQDIQPSLARFNQTSMQMSMEEGHALAAKNKVQFKEAVDKGIIKPGQNPWLAKGYKEQILSLQAQDYDSILRQAWTKSGASESDDPAVFKSMVDATTQTYIDKMDLKNDPTFAQTFVPQMMRSQANLIDQHTQYRQQRIVEQAKDATYRNVQGLIDGHMLYRSDADLANAIKSNVDGMVANGLPGSEANQLMVDAVADKAKAMMDPTVLNIGRAISTNAGPLGKTKYAQERFAETEQHIFALQRERDSAEWTNHERNQKLIGEGLMRDAYTRIGQDPNADISDVLKQAEFVDPEKAKTIREYQDYVRTGANKAYENPLEIAHLFADINEGRGTPGRIMALAGQYKLEPKTIDYAFERLSQHDQHGAILNRPEISRMTSDIEKVITKGELVHVDNETALRSLDAKNAFHQGLMDYAAKNPNASSTEIWAEGRRLQDIILKAIPDTATVGKSLPPAVQGQIKAEIAKAPVAAASTAKALYGSPDDLKKAIQEYNTSEGQGRIAIQAEALGMTVPDFIKAQKAALNKQPKK